MKLELKHLTPYLPYELKYKAYGDVFTMDSLDNIKVINSYEDFTTRIYHILDIEPILRPISSMTKEEAYEFGVLTVGEADMEDKEIGVGEMKLMGDTYPTIMYQDQEDEEYSVMVQFSHIGVNISGSELIPYEAYEWLFRNHFDVFGLIDKGLAIEK